MSTTTPQYRTVTGRVIGPDGKDRREILLERVEEHVSSTSWHKASVIEVSRMAECSPATFYQYWKTLEAAVAEIIKNKTKKQKPLGRHWIRIREDLKEFGGWEF